MLGAARTESWENHLPIEDILKLANLKIPVLLQAAGCAWYTERTHTSSVSLIASTRAPRRCIANRFTATKALRRQ